MKLIGLMMIAGENDILPTTIAAHEQIVDAFYVLDGTTPNHVSAAICRAAAKCAGYATDADVPKPRFPERPVDGYRQFIYEHAVSDHGFDNWFLLLHGDEIWRFDPRPLTTMGADGFIFDLPFYFPRAGEPWDDTRSPLEQLRWRLGPGFPEFRMFKGSENVRFDERQHFNVMPSGLHRLQRRPEQIDHYLYRSPAAQRARAQQHLASGFDPDNYRHIAAADKVFWDDEMIASYQSKPYFRELAHV